MHVAVRLSDFAHFKYLSTGWCQMVYKSFPKCLAPYLASLPFAVWSSNLRSSPFNPNLNCQEPKRSLCYEIALYYLKRSWNKCCQKNAILDKYLYIFLILVWINIEMWFHVFSELFQKHWNLRILIWFKSKPRTITYVQYGAKCC